MGLIFAERTVAGCKSKVMRRCFGTCLFGELRADTVLWMEAYGMRVSVENAQVTVASERR